MKVFGLFLSDSKSAHKCQYWSAWQIIFAVWLMASRNICLLYGVLRKVSGQGTEAFLLHLVSFQFPLLDWKALYKFQVSLICVILACNTLKRAICWPYFLAGLFCSLFLWKKSFMPSTLGGLKTCSTHLTLAALPVQAPKKFEVLASNALNFSSGFYSPGSTLIFINVHSSCWL